MDNADNIYVADTWNHRVQVIRMVVASTQWVTIAYFVQLLTRYYLQIIDKQHWILVQYIKALRSIRAFSILEEVVNLIFQVMSTRLFEN